MLGYVSIVYSRNKETQATTTKRENQTKKGKGKHNNSSRNNHPYRYICINKNIDRYRKKDIERC